MSSVQGGRRLVMCFDGTNEEFGAMNTNVVRFYSALDQSEPDKQLTYYQPGIGTYVPPALGLSKVLSAAAKAFDEAVAWYLDAHILEGYRFLMNNYKRGDKIYMLGHSRGAYTARCLAGMLDKVGLLTKGNEQQVQFAYQKYKGTSEVALIEAQGFKETFGQRVEIEFLGCWDTVASVGIMYTRYLPFSSSDKIIKTFRQALALDEHRVRFLPNPWHLPTRHDDEEFQAFELEDGHWRTDVKEVWFTGGHGDIGGGNYSNDISQSLSNLPLQWMLSELLATQPGIIFKSNAFKNIPAFNITKPPPLPPRLSQSFEGSSTQSFNGTSSSNILFVTEEDPLTDASQPVWDALTQKSVAWFWWLMEVLPMTQNWQTADGKWHTVWLPHLGAPRRIQRPNPNFHSSVRLREKNLPKYKPKAKFTGMPRYMD